MINPAIELAGTELINRTKISAGTLYPILGRLEEAGWLHSQWEKIDPKIEKRPRRRYYKITPLGIRCISPVFAQLHIGQASLEGMAYS